MAGRISSAALFLFRFFLTASIFFACAVVHGQYYFERVIDAVPVEREGERMVFPFLGGLDRFLPQFVDIDADSDLDLFLLKPFLSAQDKRLEGRLLWFENLGGAPFPELHVLLDFYHDLDVHNWFYFLDIDADGDLDLLHDNGAKGITFRRNVGSLQRAEFALVTETMTGGDGQPVHIEFTSIPTFCDIDADGDFDFFTGLAIGTIALYRNAGSPAEPVFELETERWEDLIILSGAKTLLFRHGANGIEFHDLDGDGDFDFFYGDFFHKGVYHLRNSGTAQDPQVAITDTLWPPPQPVETLGFNIPRFADWDEDGDADFFAASLLQFRNNFLFYVNEGSPSSPQFRPETDHFLSMLDAGSYSAPACADLDGDGDQDLIIGNLEGNLVYYENIGTSSRPAFLWVTDRFQNMRVRGTAHPAFVDIDDDRDWDLFVGSFEGTIAFFENRGSVQAPDYVLQTSAVENIDVELAVAPHFADFDHDDDYDLVIGSGTGTIFFYENVGNSNTAQFIYRTAIEPGTQVSDTSPIVYDLNADLIADLLIGQRNGRILHYEGTGLQGGMDFVLIANEFANLRAGAASAPALAHLIGSSYFDLILGEEAGGLNFFSALPSDAVHEPQPLPAQFTLEVYPNPFQKDLHVIMRAGRAIKLFPQASIFNLTGGRVAEMEMREHQPGVWSAHRSLEPGLAAGVYFVQVSWENVRLTQKILLVH